MEQEIINRFKKQKRNIENQIQNDYDEDFQFKSITPEKFNNGYCDFFAEVMSNEYSDIKYMSSDDVDSLFNKIYDFYPKPHAFIKYKNRFYDFENLGGVDNPLQLKFYQRQLNK